MNNRKKKNNWTMILFLLALAGLVCWFWPIISVNLPQRGNSATSQEQQVDLFQELLTEQMPTAVPVIIAAPVSEIQQTAPLVIVVPARDFTEEVVTMNRALVQAQTVYATCAKAVIANPLNPPNCKSVYDHLLAIKEKHEELQAAIRASK